jgi:hypothetical protein
MQHAHVITDMHHNNQHATTITEEHLNHTAKTHPETPSVSDLHARALEQ